MDQRELVLDQKQRAEAIKLLQKLGYKLKVHARGIEVTVQRDGKPEIFALPNNDLLSYLARIGLTTMRDGEVVLRDPRADIAAGR